MKNNIYTCIEIGNYEIKILVCNLREERLFVLSQKCVKSIGIARGQITNFDKLVNQIKIAKDLVEKDLLQPIKNIILTVPPIDVTIEHVMGRVNLDVKQPINSTDVRKLFRQVMAQSHFEGFLPVGLIPRLFRIDENHIVQNPCGLSGMNLGIEASRILMPATIVANLVHAVETSGFSVDELIVGSISETLLTLGTPEMYARTCYINVGHGLTTLTIVNDGRILHARSLLIGGHDLTKQIADAFNINVETAQQLKDLYGRVLLGSAHTPDDQVIYINEKQDPVQYITRDMLNRVVTDFAHGLFGIIRSQVADDMRLREQEYHYSLAGGSAEIPNVLYALQNQLPMAATIQRPPMLGVRDSKFSSLVGVAIFAHELTLLLGKNSNTNKMDFNIGLQQPTNIPVKSKKDIVPIVDKVSSPSPSTRSNNPGNVKSLKDAIANTATNKTAAQKARNAAPVKKVMFDDLTDDFVDDFPSQSEVEALKNEYMDQKLENSSVLARFFGKILNDDEENIE